MKILKLRYLSIQWLDSNNFGIIRITSLRGFEWYVFYICNINIDQVNSCRIFKYILIDLGIQWLDFNEFGIIVFVSLREFEWYIFHIFSINIDWVNSCWIFKYIWSISVSSNWILINLVLLDSSHWEDSNGMWLCVSCL